MGDTEAVRLNNALIEIHAKRLADLGSDESGLFGHYVGLVKEKAVVRPQDLAILNLISEELPAFEEYVVLRAGLGELALLLERTGLRTQACEANARRFRALTASVDRLSRLEGPDDQRLRAFEGFLPPAVRAHPALAVAVDFAYNVAVEDDENFRLRLRRFDAILFNPRLFIHARTSDAEQQASIDYLRALGFDKFTDFPQELILATRVEGAAPPEVDAPQPVWGTFSTLVERVMSLVPQPALAPTGSTWVERRIRHFDMKSAFGNGE